MASIKVILRPNSNKDGNYTLNLQIVKNRKTSLISLRHSLAESDWDAAKQRVKKSHPNSARLNNMLAKKIAEANEKLLELESNDRATSGKVVAKAIVSKAENTFFKQAQIYLNELKKAGKFNRRSADEPRVNRFKEFLENTDITFPEITPGLLKKFKAYLKGTRNISERTIVNHLVVIRSIFNQAVDAGLADKKYYPFGKGKVLIKFPDSQKIGLTAEEIKTIETIELSEGENHARNLWLISFYFAGMRVSDVLRLKWSDFHDGRLYYIMGKNNKAGSIKVPEKALRILEQYSRDTTHDLVFPDLAKMPDLSKSYEVQNYIKTRVRSCNDYLKKIAEKAEITKPISMHISRHSFAQISEDKIPTNILQRLYRHSDIKTTMGYQSHFIHKTTDDALEAVIG
jgi:integrase